VVAALWGGRPDGSGLWIGATLEETPARILLDHGRSAHDATSVAVERRLGDTTEWEVVGTFDVQVRLSSGKHGPMTGAANVLLRAG
jgi:hypothetical protein